MPENGRAVDGQPSPEGSPPKRPPLDEEIVQELQMLAEGDDDVLAELVDAYVDDTTTRIRHLHEAVDNADGHALAEIAHSLKGSSCNMGAQLVSELCASLGELGHQNQVGDDAARLLARLEDEFARAESALKTLA